MDYYIPVSLLMKIFNTFIQRNLSDIEYKRLTQLGWVSYLYVKVIS